MVCKYNKIQYILCHYVCSNCQAERHVDIHDHLHPSFMQKDHQLPNIFLAAVSSRRNQVAPSLRPWIKEIPGCPNGFYGAIMATYHLLTESLTVISMGRFNIFYRAKTGKDSPIPMAVLRAIGWVHLGEILCPIAMVAMGHLIHHWR